MFSHKAGAHLKRFKVELQHVNADYHLLSELHSCTTLRFLKNKRVFRNLAADNPFRTAIARIFLHFYDAHAVTLGSA